MILNVEQYHEFLNQVGFYQALQEGILSWEQQMARIHVPPYFKEMKQALYTLYFQSLQKIPSIVLPEEEILQEILRDILGIASDIPITNKDHRNSYRSVASLLQYYFNYYQLSHLDPENIILITRESLQRLLQMEYMGYFLLNTFAESPFLQMFQKTTQNIFQEVGTQSNGAAFLILHSSFKTLRTRIQEFEEKRTQSYNQLSEGYSPREDWQKQTQHLLSFLEKMEQAKYASVEISPEFQISSSRLSGTASFPVPMLSPLPEETPPPIPSPIPKPVTTRFQTFPRPATQRVQTKPATPTPTQTSNNTESQKIQPKYSSQTTKNPSQTTKINLSYTFSPTTQNVGPTPYPQHPNPYNYQEPYATEHTPIPYTPPYSNYPPNSEQTYVTYPPTQNPYPDSLIEETPPPNTGAGFGKLAELYPNLLPPKSPPTTIPANPPTPPTEIKAKPSPTFPPSQEKTTKSLRPVKGFSKKLTKKTSLSQLLAQQEEPKSTTLQKKQHIVLIEPDQEQLHSLQNQLEQNGFSITAFSQGKKALDYLLLERPHLILSETLLDQIDGFTLFTLVKNKKGDAFPPFIFYTHVNDPSWIQQALQMGATDYLLKPLHFEVLLTKLSVYLTKPSTPDKTETYSGLSGSLSEAALEDVLMMISKTGKDTCLNLQEKEMTGKIFFREGEVLHAETGELKGLDAVVQFLGWKEAYFFCNTEESTTQTSLTHIPLEYILLEVARMMDEKSLSDDHNGGGGGSSFLDQ